MDITVGQRQFTEETGQVFTDATALQEAASKIGVDVKHKGVDTRGVTEEKLWDKLKASAKQLAGIVTNKMRWSYGGNETRSSGHVPNFLTPQELGWLEEVAGDKENYSPEERLKAVNALYKEGGPNYFAEKVQSVKYPKTETEQTPNPDTLKFLPGRVVSEIGPMEFLKTDKNIKVPLASKILILLLLMSSRL